MKKVKTAKATKLKPITKMHGKPTVKKSSSSCGCNKGS